MTEARYRGQKVVVVSPDYSDHTKFADDWLACAPGTDAALAMSMGHVVLTEFFRDRQVPYFTDYAKTYTDLPFLVTLREHGDAYVPDRFLTAADLGDVGDVGDGAEHQTVLIDAATGEPVLPNGTLASRYGDDGVGKWNLDLGGVDPLLTLYGRRRGSRRRRPGALRRRRDRGRRARSGAGCRCAGSVAGWSPRCSTC